MSFAEFLRFQWGGPGGGAEEAGGVGQQQQQQPQQQGQQQQQQQQQRRGGAGDRRGRNNNVVGGGNNNRGGLAVAVAGGGGGGAPIEGEIDDIVFHDHTENFGLDDPLAPFVNHLMARGEDSVDDDDYESSDTEGEGGDEGIRIEEGEVDDANVDVTETNDAHVGRIPPPVVNDEEDQLEAFMRAQEDQEMMDDGDDRHHRDHDDHRIDDGPDPARNPPGGGDDDDDDVPVLVMQPPPLHEVNVPNPPHEVNVPNPRPREDVRFEPQFEPLRPAFADMDAQDDGPVSAECYLGSRKLIHRTLIISLPSRLSPPQLMIFIRFNPTKGDGNKRRIR